MSTSNKAVYALLAVLVVALGIVGGIDYRDAKMAAQVESEDTVRLKCLPMSFQSSYEQPSPVSGRSALQRFAVNYVVDIDPETVQTVFHCVVVDD